ncbi:MAG TPA: hypothetical protein VFM85_03565 [Actinomycetota bacterium]|nr:hypothetical protein [Actinomycetota bacterium]
MRAILMVSVFLLPIAVACTAEPSREGPATTSPPSGATGELDPADFALPVDNPYFPLKPGTTYRHEGIKEGERAVDVFAVTHHTKTILGIPNTVVVDKLFVDGQLEEIAHDWYTQDVQGNVWYFGETIQEFDRRGDSIPAKGAWQAGVDGARPGIVMPARPRVGDVFRPEYYKGTAEDRYRILDLSATVKTPFGTFSNVLVMTEQSRLEPGILGLKFHAVGFGQIKESVPEGPHETLSLVSVTRGG